jgi:putative membrane protein
LSQTPTESDPRASEGVPVDPVACAYQQQLAWAQYLHYAQYFQPRRLHPATVFLQVVAVLRSFAFIAVIAIVIARMGGRGQNAIELILVLMGGLSIVGAVWKYMSTHYVMTGQTLTLNTGVIFKQAISIRLDRIQNVNLKQHLLHRFFGVAELHVETASGASAEVSLQVIKLEEAQWLRAALMSVASTAKAGASAIESGAPPEQGVASQGSPWAGDAGGEMSTMGAAPARDAPGSVVYRAGLGRLILAGATHNRALQLVAGVFFTAMWFFEMFDGNGPGLPRVSETVRRLEIDLTSVRGLTMVAGVIVAGWVASMVMTVVGKHGFTLSREGPRFQRTFGLFTRHTASFPAKRVQMVRVEQPLVQRKLGFCRVLVDTAGSFNDNDRSSTPEVVPIIGKSEVDPIIEQIVPAVRFSDVQWRRVSRKTIGRSTVRLTVLLGIVMSMVAASAGPMWWWGLCGVPLVALGLAYLRWRALGYTLTDQFVGVRSGILTRVHRFVPHDKVQASFVRRGPMQRWLGLASFEVLTAGTMLQSSASVPDLMMSDAVALQEQLHARKSDAEARSQKIEESAAQPPATPEIDNSP